PARPTRPLGPSDLAAGEGGLGLQRTLAEEFAMKRHLLLFTAALLVTGSLVACGGGNAQSKADEARGGIKIWLSNNKEEVAWGEAMVAAWNAAHASEQVTAEQIPAGRTSEEV